MSKRLRLYMAAATILLNAVGCAPYKKVPYFQDLGSNAGVTVEEISNYSAPKIEPGDLLGINVVSLNPDASAIFNYNLNRISGNNNETSSTNPVTGYLVDSSGNIHLPYIGNYKVAGTTLNEIRLDLENKLKVYLKSPVVNIRILNFKVSVLGDVLRPDVYTISDERVTITEALSRAGDLNITAKRSNILLIRERSGKREYIPINLHSKKLFSSPYYYLRNNDVIYVQPGKAKYATVDRGYRTGSLILSSLSIIAIVFSAVYR